jgi:hypothetical protein
MDGRWQPRDEVAAIKELMAGGQAEGQEGR